MSSSEAHSLLRNFRPTSTPWQLDWDPVAARLAELIEEPRALEQGGLNICGPATFFRIWLQVDPAAVVRFATSLYETGTTLLGDIPVRPRPGSLIEKDHADLIARGHIQTPSAEWMMMGALRDSENAWGSFDGDGWDTFAGITTPAELTRWLAATGAFQTVSEEANSLVRQPLAHALSLFPSESRLIAMLTHARILKLLRADKTGPRDEKFHLAFPNHWVTLEALSQQNDQLDVSIWSFGRLYRGSISAEAFADEYYGAIIATG